jgi:hypothetical protein
MAPARQAIGRAPEGEPNFEARMARAARGITPMECPWNRDRLVGRDASPLKYCRRTASPIRAAAALDA